MWSDIGVVIGAIVGAIGTLAGTITSVYLFRRARRAEGQSKEIATADEMIELVKKANAEVINLKEQLTGENRALAEERKRENEKLHSIISKLERAIRAIGVCAFRDQCPVTDRLQGDKGNGKHRQG